MHVVQCRDDKMAEVKVRQWPATGFSMVFSVLALILSTLRKNTLNVFSHSLICRRLKRNITGMYFMLRIYFFAKRLQYDTVLVVKTVAIFTSYCIFYDTNRTVSIL